MARKTTTTARLRVRTSFDGFRRGEEHEGPLEGPVLGWLKLGLMEVIEGGEDPTGQGSTEPDVPGNESE